MFICHYYLYGYCTAFLPLNDRSKYLFRVHVLTHQKKLRSWWSELVVIVTRMFAKEVMFVKLERRLRLALANLT